MVESGSRTRFTSKALQGCRVIRQILWQKLQRYAPAKLEVLRRIDNTHSPATQDLEDPIVRDPVTDEALVRSVLGSPSGRRAWSRNRKPAFVPPNDRSNEAVSAPRDGLDINGAFGGVGERDPQLLDCRVDALVKRDDRVIGPQRPSDL